MARSKVSRGAQPGRRVARWSGARLSRRLLRSVPYLGAVVAVASVGEAIRRKGLVRGAVDTGLNAIPFVGAAKNLAELVRGRDFLEDRRAASRSRL